MKKIVTAIIIICLIPLPCLAKGGFSSGGRGGFSSGGFSRSFSSPRSSFSSGSFRSYSSPRTTTTTTINRSYGGGYGGYYHPLMMYPGFGMGYGYNNGLITGLILGNMMYPQGTTVYSGGGYTGNALLFPDGRVSDQNGYQVGTYINGQFTPMQNGPMIAQPAPQQQVPVSIGWSPWQIFGAIMIGVLLVLIIFALAS